MCLLSPLTQFHHLLEEFDLFIHFFFRKLFVEDWEFGTKQYLFGEECLNRIL